MTPQDTTPNEMYDYYIFPKDEQLDLVIDTNTAIDRKYKASQEEWDKMLAGQQCYINQTTYKTCNCNGPSGPFTRQAKCEHWVYNDGTTVKPCGVRCESCYAVCQ